MACWSSSATKWALPLTVECISAPPTSAIVVARPVTALITSGPVRNMCALLRVMITKSISAGE
jgi:hypothetical protein